MRQSHILWMSVGKWCGSYWIDDRNCDAKMKYNHNNNAKTTRGEIAINLLASTFLSNMLQDFFVRLPLPLPSTIKKKRTHFTSLHSPYRYQSTYQKDVIHSLLRSYLNVYNFRSLFQWQPNAWTVSLLWWTMLHLR